MSAKRDEYLEKIKQQLDEWNGELDKLEAKQEEVKGEAKTKYNTQVKELQQKLRSVQDKVQELQSSGQDKWDELQAEVDNVRDAFVHSYNYFKSQL